LSTITPRLSWGRQVVAMSPWHTLPEQALHPTPQWARVSANALRRLRVSADRS
jgi:hypothetical protein